MDFQQNNVNKNKHSIVTQFKVVKPNWLVMQFNVADTVCK